MIEWIADLASYVLLGLACYGLLKLFTGRRDLDKQAAILWVLRQSGERTMTGKDLSDITGIGRSDIYLQLYQLERKGFVRSERDSKAPHQYRYSAVPSINEEQQEQQP